MSLQLRPSPLVLLTLLLGCAGGVETPRPEGALEPAQTGQSTGPDEDETGTTEPSIDSTTTDSGDATSSTATTDRDPATSGDDDGDVDPTGGVDPSTSTSTTGEDPTTTGTPSIVDLSGWTLRQTDSFREFTIPAGTQLMAGQSLLVIRGAPVSSFESFWSAAVGDAVIVAGADEFPAINGAETYTLLDDNGNVVDGPTPALVLGDGLVRDEPVEGDVWTAATAGTAHASPGDGHASDGDGSAYIAEVSDAPGNGTFDNEFIEIRLR